jgi:hypothetical protein
MGVTRQAGEPDIARRQIGEAIVGILFPEPIAAAFGEVAEATLAERQLLGSGHDFLGKRPNPVVQQQPSARDNEQQQQDERRAIEGERFFKSVGDLPRAGLDDKAADRRLTGHRHDLLFPPQSPTRMLAVGL